MPPLPAEPLIPLSKPLLALLSEALVAAEADDAPREAPAAAAAGAPVAGAAGAGPPAASASASSDPGAATRGRMLGQHVRGSPMGVYKYMYIYIYIYMHIYIHTYIYKYRSIYI